MRLAVHQAVAGVEGAQGAVVEHGVAAAEADLVEAHAGADEDRERAGRDLGVERAGVAGLDAVEFGAAVGDQAGEEVEAAGGALGVGDGGDVAGKGEALDERDDVDAALLQHRAVPQVDAVHLEIGEAVGERRGAAGKERGADAVGFGAEAEVEAGGLDLADGGRGGDGDRAVLEHPRDALGGDYAGRTGDRVQGYGRASEIRTHDLSTPSRTRYQTAL